MHAQESVGYDTVAIALFDAFTKGNSDEEKDNSLTIFLTKLFKNNTSIKPKRMNSIRMSRFNAFLYRINNPFPSSQEASKIIHASLLAMLSNSRNFQEEEDEDIVMSIARWASQMLENTVKNGFYQETVKTIREILARQRGGQVSVNMGVQQFQEILRQCQEISSISLSAQDQRRAMLDHPNHNLTTQFSIVNSILSSLNLKELYSTLFQNYKQRNEVLQLFSNHLKVVSIQTSRAQLFVQTFLTDSKLIGEQLRLILKTLEDNWMGIQGIRMALKKIMALGLDMRQVLKLQLQNTRTQELFLQILKQQYSSSKINNLIQIFLTEEISNMIAPSLISNAIEHISVENLNLIFKEGELTQKEVIIVAFILIQFHEEKLLSKLMGLWENRNMGMDQTKNGLLVRALYFGLSQGNKSTFLAKIAQEIHLTKINQNKVDLNIIPQGTIRPEKLTNQDKTKLTRILSQSNIRQDCLLLKIQLSGLCGQNVQMTKRISYLQNLFQLPVEEILKAVTRDDVNKDPVLLAALLMGLNNRMEVAFIEEPDQKALIFLATYYSQWDFKFGRKLGELLNEKSTSPMSYYLWCLSRFNIQTGQTIGGFSEPLNSLLSGQKKYNRLSQTDFAAYFYREQHDSSLVSELWTQKKILMEIRRMLRKLLRKDKSLNELLKEIHGMLTNEYSHVLAIKLVFSYYQAVINNPDVLRKVLQKLVPEFGFFQRVYTMFQNQNEQYIDFLTYIPNLLYTIYPQTLEFLVRLIDSVPAARKEKEKRKSKKKKSTDKIQTLGGEDMNPIFDIQSLFDYFRKAKSFGALFGDPSNLQSYDHLFRIFLKLPQQDISSMRGLVQNWLQMLCIFHPQKQQEQRWRSRVLSYCRIWKVIFFQLGYQLKLQTLSRHFDILAELLNMHYESKSQSIDLEEQLLMTLLIVLQGGQLNTMNERDNLPIESIKNCLLGYKLPIPYQQHFFFCHTCTLSVCQVCAPFLHKHHDLTYTGKDSTCVHDSSMKKPVPVANQAQSQQLQQQERQNIFSYNSRPSRREEDLFALNFDMGEEEMEYNQHIRFRELMQYRLHEQQRQRERQAMRQRMQRIQYGESIRARASRQLGGRGYGRGEAMPPPQSLFANKDEVVVGIEEQRQERVNDNEDNGLEIRSQSSKSICNIQKGFSSSHMIQPQFTPEHEPQSPSTSTIDARPLRHILMRQLQMTISPQAEQGRSKAQLFKERYNFFKQSNYFKTARGQYGGLIRGLGPGVASKRNLLTANKKFMAFPSASNGILMISVTVLGMKVQRRQNTRAMADYQTQRTYISNAINNSNLAFEPFQLLFGKSGLLAVVGVTQLGFFVLSADGKVQRFMQSQLKCAQPISKFQWIGKQRSNVFAVSYGSTIRMGSISEDLRVRLGNRMKVQIDKVIGDFEVGLQNHAMNVYIVDSQGGIYWGEFDFRDTRAINISDKKINKPELGQVQSVILFNKKLLVSNNQGKMHLLQLQQKSSPSILQSYDLQQLLSSCSQSKLKGQFSMLNPKIIHISDNLISIACLLAKHEGQGKKKGSALGVLRIGGSKWGDMELLVLSQEENVQHFQVIQFGENSFGIVVVEETGTVWVAPYALSAQILLQRQDTKIPLTQQSIASANKVLRQQKLLSLTRYVQPRRCSTYKQHKQLTPAYLVQVDHPFKITLRAKTPYKYFITGVSLHLEAGQKGEIAVWVNGQERKSWYEKSREIQVGWGLKDSLWGFTQDQEIVIPYKTTTGTLQDKNIKIYGIQFSQQSIYKNAYSQLHRLVTLNYLYDDKNILHYLQNPQKSSLPKANLCQLQRLLISTHKYSHKEFTLLMKLELLKASTTKGLKDEELEEMLMFVRAELLPQSQKRQFLEKSCWRLMKQLCCLILPQGGRVGHPYEFRTALDLYYFQRSYQVWSSTRQLGSFQKLVTLLYGLIFKRISNLYLILRLNPNLIYELTFYYKNALHSLKHSGEPHEQIQLAKLINICPSYVALVCEYYQTLKNTPSEKMVDQNHNQDHSSPEKVVLDLLEEVFCATKKQLYRQIFISPELYLDRLYLSSKKNTSLLTNVDIFGLRNETGGPTDHQSRKESIGQIEAAQSEESDIQLQEESEKEMMEQELRQMPGQSLLQPLRPVQLSASKVQVVPSTGMASQLPKTLRKLTSLLASYLLPNEHKVNFIYYQFSLQMLTALFKLQKYLTKQNAVFYLGFVFNLLRIVEFNADQERDKDYLNVFWETILKAVREQEHSLLFMVLNYFFEPTYGPKNVENKANREMKGPKTRLSELLCTYLAEQKTDIEQLFTSIKVTKISKAVSMTKAMKFVPFQLQNQWYQLNFLGSLYITLKQKQHRQLTSPSKKIKQFVLSTVVRYKVRVFNNIMLSEHWKEELEASKIEVGFEALKEKKEEGIKILEECAKSQAQVFVKKLQGRKELVTELQELLGDKMKGVDQNAVLQMLNVYYGSD